MKKNELQQRWEVPGYEMYTNNIFQSFSQGSIINSYLSPFGLYDGRIDFRGMNISACMQINFCHFEHVDFTYSGFNRTRIENCTFMDVLFDECDFSDIIDMNNKYHSCSFYKTDFTAAGIGHRGSSYDCCAFHNSKFRRTRFIRPEFHNCVFDNCKLKNNEFNASAFEKCTFIGKLHGVSFSNGYFLGDQVNSKLGTPRENRMRDVSFAQAELKDLDLRWNCDLSTVIMPETGDYRKYGKFAERLKVLRNKLPEFPEDARDEINNIFITIYLRMALSLKQNMYILNCDEIRKKYGQQVGQKMIDILDSAILDA